MVLFPLFLSLHYPSPAGSLYISVALTISLVGGVGRCIARQCLSNCKPLLCISSGSNNNNNKYNNSSRLTSNNFSATTNQQQQQVHGENR